MQRILIRVILPILAVIAVGVGGWAWFRVARNGGEGNMMVNTAVPAASSDGIIVTPTPIAPSPDTTAALNMVAVGGDAARVVAPGGVPASGAPAMAIDDDGLSMDIPENDPEPAASSPEPAATPIPSQPPFVPPGTGRPDGEEDPDEDGLTNDQEAAQQTDPFNSDTDGDGLLDGEEVRTYRTDPLNPDTDGDGYSDGIEVDGGYNPNGPGTL